MKNFVNILEMLNMEDGQLNKGVVISKRAARSIIAASVIEALNELDIYTEEEEETWNHEFNDNPIQFNVFRKTDLEAVVELIADHGSQTAALDHTFWFA